ncbi:Piso0_001918 [Millerozyma farinosa CBS 7064]|uniref:Mediator of RNA polymerase II transcription subunit 13 n=1 Tax=Pichia sorbitophila (strain ATCC MYA-4447 / BCRC 22081 / CBS 7064 / NBRC 10061 / NRRL Y-12695) TaxID=559304 RepID=G8YM17_PICSO|nr:Piso0_001918 [Millerozyma farinosa CBS 7064]
MLSSRVIHPESKKPSVCYSSISCCSILYTCTYAIFRRRILDIYIHKLVLIAATDALALGIMETIHPKNVLTNYYKIGHINEVEIYVYGTKTKKSDQYLLELELEIRNTYPKVLVTYYNKFLFQFHFCFLETKVDLSTLYPDLYQESFFKVKTDVLANPNKPGYLPYYNVSFLKATKKLFLYSLSKSNKLKLFGNHAITKKNDGTYRILQIDPILLTNGDIYISVFEKLNPYFFDSVLIPADELIRSDLTYIIYLIPSGIRCHLYSSEDISSCFTKEAPDHSTDLLELIKKSTGIDLCEERELLWVKLIPNLQHLNNQTSKIAQFIHTVTNKKTILWPWCLCVLQYGFCEEEIGKDDVNDKLSDPLNVIADFIELNIEYKNSNNTLDQNNNTHMNANLSDPSFLSTGLSSVGPYNDLKSDSNLEEYIQPNETHRNHVPSPLSSAAVTNSSKSENQQKEQDEETDEINDLFGDASDGSDAEMSSLADQNAQEKIDTKSDINSDDNRELDESLAAYQLEKNEKEDRNMESGSTVDRESQNKGTFIDIPKDQMTIISAKPMKLQSPRIYSDPGAPLPMDPTPIIPQGSFAFGGNTSNVFPGSNNNTSESEEPKSRSIFSPIPFNPIIKSNIDTKYGKGGKFYVEKETTMDSDSRRNALRATSISGNDLALVEDSMKGLEQPLNRTTQEDTIMPSAKRFSQSKPSFSADELLGKETFKRQIAPDNDGESTSAHAIGFNDEVIQGEGDDHPEADSSEDADEEEEEEEEEEESDEDDDMTQDNVFSKSSYALKLNTFNGPQNGTVNTGNGGQEGIHQQDQEQVNQGLLRFSNINEGSIVNKNLKTSTISPSNTGNYSGNSENVLLSPQEMEQDNMQDSLGTQGPVSLDENIERTMDSTFMKKEPTEKGEGTPKTSSVSESSNCLPLILRNVNINTIPERYILNNLSQKSVLNSKSEFSMELEERDEKSDFELRRGNEMRVSISNIDLFLTNIISNLIFDDSVNDYFQNMRLNNPTQEKRYSTKCYNCKTPDEDVEKKLFDVFPFMLRSRLNEFMREESNGSIFDDDAESRDPMNNEIDFLGDIADESLLHPNSQEKEPKSLEWICFSEKEESNSLGFNSYVKAMKEHPDTTCDKASEEQNLFQLCFNKIKIISASEKEINLNSISLRFWKYLNFKPLHGPKNFQLLLVSEQRHGVYRDELTGFLNSLIYNYKNSNFGEITKVSLMNINQDAGTSTVNDGVLTSDDQQIYTSNNDYYLKVNKSLDTVAELIKLDLINKSNRFEFDRPLLLLFVNFDKRFNSLVQLSSLCRNFMLFLRKHHVPLVEVFSHIIPFEEIIHEVKGFRRLKYLSSYNLTRLSMNLYNKCPEIISHSKGDIFQPKKLFTQFIKEPPHKLHFKFLDSNNGNIGTEYIDDVFLHFAYERSIDKRWIVGAWSDPLGMVTNVKSWYCKNQKKNDNDIFDLESICDDIWEISSSLFKALNEEMANQMSCFGGKKFLVLTRINSVIPDDELVHWKRLSSKNKDISLIVLSADNKARLLAADDIDKVVANSQHPLIEQNYESPSPEFSKFSGSGYNSNPSTQPSPSNTIGALGTSPPTNSSMHSPYQFLNMPGNYLSPQDLIPSNTGHSAPQSNENSGHMGSEDLILQDLSQIITAFIPKVTLPSCHSPLKYCLKMGYLIKPYQIKPQRDSRSFLTFEVSLLSCSNYWNLDAIMRIILKHYKKLISLGDILCVENNFSSNYRSSTNGLVPWHIAAVSKTLDYLVHVDVEE